MAGVGAAVAATCATREAEPLAAMLAGAREAAAAAAAGRDCELAEQPVWRIEPIAFDPRLVAAGDAGGRGGDRDAEVLTSGALHDAAEVARVLPAAMIFCSSRRGISHAPEEDSPEDHLFAGAQSLAEAAAQVLARPAN